jgi:hypothetical protein
MQAAKLAGTSDKLAHVRAAIRRHEKPDLDLSEFRKLLPNWDALNDETNQ